MKAKQTILVVDDEERFRQLIHSYLSKDYEVLLAADGREAIGCYELHAERIAAVITDVRMPVVNGRELVEWLHRRKRHLPVILMSGHAGQLEIEHLLRRREVIWLEKPFDFKELVLILKSMLKTSEGIA